MDIVASIIKALFGSKADKDRKQIEPYLEKIKAVYPSIEKLTNDELRAHSEALKKQIADFIAADEARIVELKAILEKPETSARREGENFEGDRRNDQAHRRENRGGARRNPSRGIRHYEGYGAPFRTERDGRGDGKRLRPQPGGRRRISSPSRATRPFTRHTGSPAATTRNGT